MKLCILLFVSACIFLGGPTDQRSSNICKLSDPQPGEIHACFSGSSQLLTRYVLKDEELYI